MNLSPERAAELERWREEVRNEWRISADCNDPPSEAERAWDMVLLEMQFSCSNLDRCLSVAGYAKKWIKSGNPFYIDAAVYLCGLEGIAPPPALAQLVADVAQKRFFGKSKSGTADKILKENARTFAMTRMAKMCAAGEVQEMAASKIARLMSDMDAGIVFKASTIEKYYVGEWRDLEEKMRKIFADDAEHLAEWQAAIALMPEADDDLKGVVR